MLKESENPPLIWPEDASISDFTGLWWVAHTKSRNEKALAHDLCRKNISYFLPMTWKVHSSRGRKLKSLLPLFGGYLFFCSDEKQRVEVLRTNRVANLIEVKDRKKFLGELSSIERVLREGTLLVPHKYLKAGQKCRVISGSLRDLEGIVFKTKSTTRLILKIDMLGQAASVEVDSDLIELID